MLFNVWVTSEFRHMVCGSVAIPRSTMDEIKIKLGTTGHQPNSVFNLPELANTVPDTLRFRYLPELRHTSIQQRRLNMKEEFANNRGMAIMPLQLTTKLFEKLADCGYINTAIHKPCLWAGAAVMISSNDSARDIDRSDSKLAPAGNPQNGLQRLISCQCG